MGYLNGEILYGVEQLKPDLTIIIKGQGILGETIRQAKEKHNHPIVGWIFDVTMNGTMLKDATDYISFIKELDTFYTIDNDAVPELKELGVNAKWLSEGCHPADHGEAVFNKMQARRFGADIVFLGSVGSIHPNRSEFLSRIHEEGFRFKLYGRVNWPENEEPDWVKDSHTGYEAINDYHSLACGASKIVIGIDGWPHRDKSYSARLYRTLCAGGFLLTTTTKGLDEEFIPGEHLDVFSTPDEMIEKIQYYLGNDEEREKIAKAGQELVLEKHKFTHRLQQIVDDHK